MVIEESGIKFIFDDNAKAIKFDDTGFYRKYINQLPYSKGVDFLSVQAGRLVLTEVKNCKGNESDNNWRIFPDNQKKETSHTTVFVKKRDSLDIEIAEKVVMTISGLIGAYTKQAGSEAAECLSYYANYLLSPSVQCGNKQLLIVLFLEGDFGSETRSKIMIMHALENSIKKKLAWLNCCVSVVDSCTYQKRIFDVEM